MKKRYIYKTAIVCCLTLLASSTFASRQYSESGYINCSSTLKNDKDTVVLFANGIQNSIDDAEESRLDLLKYYSEQCPSCEFKKAYNQTDGLIDDYNELFKIGSWQDEASRYASLYVIKELYKKNEEYINKLKSRNKISDEHKSIRYKGNKVTLATLRNRNKKLFSKAYHDVLVAPYRKIHPLMPKQFYDPKRDGDDYYSAIKKYLLSNAKTDFGISFSDTRAYYDILNLELNQVKNINDAYYSKYREQLASKYFSKSDFYKDDSTAITAISKSVESLQSAISEYVLSGKKVVVVAHSQGNHIAELAYSKLKQQHKNDIDFMNAIRVVGVASVSNSTPNNAYITWNEDHTVQKIYDNTTLGRPLKPNLITEKLVINWDLKDHGFSSIYMSNKTKGKYSIPAKIHDFANYSNKIKNPSIETNARDVILELVDVARISAKAIPASITTDSPLTFQLRWEKQHKDMDLYIKEPNNSSLVSYKNKTGTYGYLDRDDQDFEGPEHYFVNKLHSCSSLSGKEWKFYVQQYPNGGNPSVVHLMLKVGNNRVLSRSFGLKKWSDEKLYVGRIKFNEDGRYNEKKTTLQFKMEIEDPRG